MKNVPLSILSFVSLATVGGCTFEPGDPLGVLRPTLDARLEAPADRARGEGWLRLSSDYEIRLDRAELDLGAIALVPGAAAGKLSFDPANPPRGYGNCHGGHCHHESGRLVPYDEIEAEIAGAGAGPTPPLATLPVGKVPLLPGETRALGCTPSCDLPRGRVTRLRAPLVAFSFSGEVRDGRSPPRLATPVRFRIERAATGAGPELTGTIDLPLDADHEPAIDLTVAVRPGPSLFDTVDWGAAVAADGAVDLAAPANAAGAEAVQNALLETELRSTVSRRPL